MRSILLLVLRVVFTVPINGKIPDGYIMKITPHCGTTLTEARIHVVTDLNADIKATCRGGRDVFFSTYDTVNFNLNVGYPQSSVLHPCMFDKRVGAEVYVIRLTVSFGEIGNEIYNNDELYTVTCSFDLKANKTSELHEIRGSLISPKEIQVNTGSETSSSLGLTITDINGRSLAESIHLGRSVMLIATSSGESGEKGIQVTACDAIASTGRSYQVLRAGCGDGHVLQKDEGFVTTDLKAKSPYFNMFHLWGDKEVTFRCNFTLCPESCDGSSCANERRRRDVETMGPPKHRAAYIRSSTNTVRTRFRRHLRLKGSDLVMAANSRGALDAHPSMLTVH